MTRVEGGLGMPDKEASEKLLKIPAGNRVTVDIKQPRNVKFHNKYFALLDFSYDHWTPQSVPDSRYKNKVPEKSFTRFRKDIAILCGHYDLVIRLDGTTRVEARSISFASMSEDEFDELYNATIDVILKHVLTNYDKQQLEQVINDLLAFG